MSSSHGIDPNGDLNKKSRVLGQAPQEEENETEERNSHEETSNRGQETQPLLDTDLERHHYLSPDDPQVSPLNIYKVRLIRVALIGTLFCNVLFFLVFLLSDFMTIPGIHTRGKSFLELDLSLLNVLVNGITLWYLNVPSLLDRRIGYVSSFLLGIDLIVMFLVPNMREQFGFPGTFLFTWTFLNFLLTSLAIHVVENGKVYQEIRYTGRPETRRTLSELAILLVKVAARSVLMLLIFCISFRLMLQAFDCHQKPWGKMVPVENNQFKVHLACFGDVRQQKESTQVNDDSQPVVLVEGGQLTSSEVFQEWIEELFHLNKIQRYCVWDRPGYAFSDSAPSPISVGIIVDYLREALRNEGIEGPFSLVSFDIGGLYSRVFASQSPGSIHSMMLVDSWHEDLLKIYPFSGYNRKNEDRKTFNNILEFMDTRTGLKLWLKGFISPLGIFTNFHWLFHPRRYSSNSRIFGSDMYYLSKYLRARFQEQVTASILSYNEVASTDIHNVPLSVVSSDFMIKNSLNWGKWQRELSQLSSNPIEWVIAENSDHFIWFSPRGRSQLQKSLLRLLGRSEEADN